MGIALRNKRDAGAEPERARRRRGERQRDEGIVGMRIALGQLAAAGIGRAPAHGDMRVLAHEQRVEAALLERARQFVDRDAVIGRKMKGTNQHSPPIQRVMPAAPRSASAIAGGCGTYSMRPRSMSCRTPDGTRAGSDEIDASAARDSVQYPLVPARGTPRRSRRGDPVAGTQGHWPKTRRALPWIPSKSALRASIARRRRA